MSNIWNLWELKPPPTCSIKTLLNVKEINNLKGTLFDILKTLESVEYLNKEAAILSRYLYKSKRTFRHDKGTRDLVKINQSLRRYLQLNFHDTVNNFKQTLPSKFQTSVSHAFLPTRQMLKWILLRLQAFSQIFKRLIILSKASGSYLYGKMSLGWAPNTGLLIFCIVARILVTSKFLLTKSIEWYNSLYKYQSVLNETAEFFPEYEFPKDLKSWLGDIDITPTRTKTSIDKVFEVIDLVKTEDNDDEENSDNESEVKILMEKFVKPLLQSQKLSEEPEIEITEEKIVKKNPPIHQIEDVGIPIDDDEDLELPPPKINKMKNGKNKKLKKK